MFTTLTMASLPKRIIDLRNQPCPYEDKINAAMDEKEKATVQ